MLSRGQSVQHRHAKLRGRAIRGTKPEDLPIPLPARFNVRTQSRERRGETLKTLRVAKQNQVFVSVARGHRAGCAALDDR